MTDSSPVPPHDKVTIVGVGGIVSGAGGIVVDHPPPVEESHHTDRTPHLDLAPEVQQKLNDAASKP